jgi:hypothetical protein
MKNLALTIVEPDLGATDANVNPVLNIDDAIDSDNIVTFNLSLLLMVLAFAANNLNKP